MDLMRPWRRWHRSLKPLRFAVVVGVLAVVAWQAGRGGSLIHPDATLTVVAAVVLATATALVLVAKRQSHPTPAAGPRPLAYVQGVS